VPPLKYQTKVIRSLSFICQSKDCPKHLDRYKPEMLRLAMRPVGNHFKTTGCAQFKTPVYGISLSHASQEEWDQAPTFGVIMPSPDPTGVQGSAGGTAGGFGMSRDLIVESILRVHQKPFKVAIFYLTRGYNFNKVVKGEFSQGALNKAAVTNCHPYLLADLNEIKPDRLLLCGPEVGDTFLPGWFDLPTARRKRGVEVTIGGRTYPAQVTFAPHICAMFPVYIHCIREDCARMLGHDYQVAPGSHRTLKTLDEALDYLDFLSEYPGFISFDTETKSLNRKAHNPLGTLQFATDGLEGVVLPYQHKDTPFSPDELQILKKRLTLLFSRKIKSAGWVIHGAKFENVICKMHFGTFVDSAPIFDTQAMAFLLDETRSERAKMDSPRGNRGIYALKALARDLLGWEGYDKGVLAHREEGTLIDLPLEELAAYGGMDAWVTFLLFERIQELAAEQGYLKQLMKLTEHYYGPVTRLIAMVEMTGFKTDLKYLRQLAARKGPIETKLDKLEEQIRLLPAFIEANREAVMKKNGGNTLGVRGNVPWILDLTKDEHKKLVFFEVLGLSPVSFSDKTGLPSIDEEFFEAYQDEFPEVKVFAQYSEYKKMRDTFITKILERVDPETGDEDCKLDQRIRASIWYSRLVTGRWAMTDPNAQQIPKAEEDEEALIEDFLVRKAVKDIFTVDRGYALVQVDYRVNEVRWAGILSQDQVLANLFNEAAAIEKEARIKEDPVLLKKAKLYADVHKMTASSMFKIAIEAVTKPMRKISKAITFGILFQQSAKALALALGITLEEAEGHIAGFFAKFVALNIWIRNTKAFAALHGYVEAPTGRRRRFWGYELPFCYEGRRSQMARNDRQAVNSPIQGIASDSAMLGGGCSLMDFIELHKRDWWIQNLVHDSALVMVPLEEVSEMLQSCQFIFVNQAMCRMEKLGVQFTLPLAIDVEVGLKWGSLQEWNGTKTHADQLQAEVTKMSEAV
jgi:DNA polymerase I-like protein with 3'-5' exonuclease and polymerase domains